MASRRGVDGDPDCLPVTRDRTGRGPVSAAQLHACLRPVLTADVLRIGDAANAWRGFARAAGITHAAVNGACGRHARGAIHIHDVNAWRSHFKSRLLRFRSVASRYLANYSRWRRLPGGGRVRIPVYWLRAAIERN